MNAEFRSCTVEGLRPFSYLTHRIASYRIASHEVACDFMRRDAARFQHLCTHDARDTMRYFRATCIMRRDATRCGAKRRDARDRKMAFRRAQVWQWMVHCQTWACLNCCGMHGITVPSVRCRNVWSTCYQRRDACRIRDTNVISTVLH